MLRKGKRAAPAKVSSGSNKKVCLRPRVRVVTQSPAFVYKRATGGVLLTLCYCLQATQKADPDKVLELFETYKDPSSGSIGPEGTDTITTVCNALVAVQNGSWTHC